MKIVRTVITTITLIFFASNSIASEKYSECREFAVGDIVEPYRHWDHGRNRWNNWQNGNLTNTRWKIIEMPREKMAGDSYGLMITIQLIYGEYKSSLPNIPNNKAGYIADFLSSNSYKHSNPDSYLQFCDEFRKVH